MALGALVMLAFTLPVPERSGSLDLSQGPAAGARVKLTYPAWLRGGEVGELTLHIDDAGRTTSSSANLTIAQAWVVADNVRPDGDQRRSFPSGGSATFSWQVAAAGGASWEGELWLALGTASGGQVLASPQPVLDRPVELKVIAPIGLDATTWRWIGAGLFLGGAILVIQSVRRRMGNREPPGAHV